jgi:protein-S-isoprenylcysteine O-methyltransferase Ste14
VLKIIDGPAWRAGRLALVYAGLTIYLFAQKHLGRNYSPCFDSHLPFEIVTTGPYGIVRHPGWLAKGLVGLGTTVATGSLWFAALFVWLLIEMRKTIATEEAILAAAFPSYAEYRAHTWMLVPFVV